MDNNGRSNILLENGYAIANLDAYVANMSNIDYIVDQLVSLRESMKLTADVNDFTNVLESINEIEAVFQEGVVNEDASVTAFREGLEQLKSGLAGGEDYLRGQNALAQAQADLEEAEKKFADLKNLDEIALTEQADQVIYERESAQRILEQATKNAEERKERYEETLKNADADRIGKMLFTNIIRLTNLYRNLSLAPEVMDKLSEAIYATRDKIVELAPVKVARYQKEYEEQLARAGLKENTSRMVVKDETKEEAQEVVYTYSPEAGINKITEEEPIVEKPAVEEPVVAPEAPVVEPTEVVEEKKVIKNILDLGNALRDLNPGKNVGFMAVDGELQDDYTPVMAINVEFDLDELQLSDEMTLNKDNSTIEVNGTSYPFLVNGKKYENVAEVTETPTTSEENIVSKDKELIDTINNVTGFAKSIIDLPKDTKMEAVDAFLMSIYLKANYKMFNDFAVSNGRIDGINKSEIDEANMPMILEAINKYKAACEELLNHKEFTDRYAEIMAAFAKDPQAISIDKIMDSASKFISSPEMEQATRAVLVDMVEELKKTKTNTAEKTPVENQIDMDAVVSQIGMFNPRKIKELRSRRVDGYEVYTLVLNEDPATLVLPKGFVYTPGIGINNKVNDVDPYTVISVEYNRELENDDDLAYMAPEAKGETFDDEEPSKVPKGKQKVTEERAAAVDEDQKTTMKLKGIFSILKKHGNAYGLSATVGAIGGLLVGGVSLPAIVIGAGMLTTIQLWYDFMYKKTGERVSELENVEEFKDDPKKASVIIVGLRKIEKALKGHKKKAMEQVVEEQRPEVMEAPSFPSVSEPVYSDGTTFKPSVPPIVDSWNQEMENMIAMAADDETENLDSGSTLGK